MSGKLIPLEQTCDFLSGYAWSAADFNADPVGLPIIRIQNVDAVRDSDFVYWGGNYDERFVVSSGDLLLTLSGSFRAVVWQGPDALLNQRIVKLTPKPGYSLDWLLHVLRNGLGAISGLGRHALVSNVALADLRQLKVLSQTNEEQRRIAAILDQAETLRTQRRTALAQLDNLIQSLFLDMFGDADTKSWPMETIADVAHSNKGSIRTGPFGSQLLHSEFVADGVSVLGIDNAVTNEFRWGERRFISEAKYRDLKRYTVKPGDVLITIMGTCGRCAVVPGNIPVAINTKHICCITLEQQKCTPAYLHAYFLRHPMARKYLAQTEKGAIMAGLNMGLIQGMPVPVPPLPLQQTFATRIQAIESLKATHRAALAQLDALFASLQQRAFAGEL